MKKGRTIFLILFDIFILNTSYFLAFYGRFDSKIPSGIIEKYLSHMVIVTMVKLIIFYMFRLYNSIWEYASIDELMEIGFAVFFANIVTTGYWTMVNADFPRSIFLMVPVIDAFLIGGIRFSFRASKRLSVGFHNNDRKNRVIIIGAGAAGVMVLKELRNHKGLHSNPIGFIDDDLKKKGNKINGISVVGNRKDIVKVCNKYNIDEIIIAMPSVNSEDRRDILNECKKTKCKTRILPGVYEFIDGKADATKIRDVQIEDLLGRDEIKLDLEGLSSFISGKRILVTGGGGSIGSELCRQIAKFNPGELMIIDIYENNAYDIQNELLKKHKNLNLTVFIASIRDKNRIDEILNKKRPHIVFHAAAHKHVPLMENNPTAAIKNNIFGTLNIVQAADKYGVNRFVMISTDKAVNPTNVMGATKRICEMIIQTYNGISKTEYVAVRFGNVLGSNGSVIPLFKRQIAEGGPVTVTDERVIRYFMTIPEACQLVLQAGTIASGGEIFILDMGEPVKIIDLARDLITLSGLEPDVDIKIEITGLRPGEKLYEEILLNKQEMTKTKFDKIYIERPMKFNYRQLEIQLELLKDTLVEPDNRKIKEALANIVPTYNPYRSNMPIGIEEELSLGYKESAATLELIK